jgi:hypothetical protein
VRVVTAYDASKRHIELYVTSKSQGINMSLTIPHFENEEQEAQWWYDHREEVEEDFVQALKDGRVKRASETERGRRVMRAAKRALAAREAAKTFLASSSEQGREHFHQLAVKAGLDDETYLQQTLLKALASAEVFSRVKYGKDP